MHSAQASSPTLSFGGSFLTAPGPYWIRITVAELFAFAIEGAFGALLGVRHPWLASLVANILSIVIGVLTRELFGWP